MLIDMTFTFNLDDDRDFFLATATHELRHSVLGTASAIEWTVAEGHTRPGVRINGVGSREYLYWSDLASQNNGIITDRHDL